MRMIKQLMKYMLTALSLLLISSCGEKAKAPESQASAIPKQTPSVIWAPNTGVSTNLIKRPEAPLFSFENLGTVSSPFSSPSGTFVSGSDRLSISGWVVDPVTKTAGSAADVAIDGHIYASDYKIARPDVASALKTQSYKNSGFVSVLGPGEVPQGVHHIAVRVIAPDGKSYLESASYEFTVR